MSYGKMNTFIDIVSAAPSRDAEGFAACGDTVLVSVRAYKEEQRGSERWANMAAFSEATALFRFRRIPDVDVDAALIIVEGARRYNIVSAEDVRGRGM
jgi:head-tail adaptor